MNKTYITHYDETPFFFYRNFGLLVKGATTALMLSKAYEWSGQSEDGWFCKTQAEWEDATLLTRREQETARKQLRNTTFWQEERRGLSSKLFFRVDFLEMQKAYREAKNNE